MRMYDLAWGLSIAWGGWIACFAQTPAPAAPALPAGIEHYSAYGLLLIVLGAVGAFLRGYLPGLSKDFLTALTQQQTLFEKTVESQREAFREEMSAEREARQKLLQEQREHHVEIVKLLRGGSDA